MTKSNERIANKIIDLLADGRITSAQWRLWIPRHINDQPEIVKMNAKLLAEGIDDLLDKKPNIEYIDLSKYDMAGE